MCFKFRKIQGPPPLPPLAVLVVSPAKTALKKFDLLDEIYESKVYVDP